MLDKTTERKVQRYIFAVGLSILVSTLFDWVLAFCTPLLTAKFMVDKPYFTALHIKQIIFALITSFVISALISTGLINYKLPFLSLYSAGLFWGYFLFTNPKWQMFATFLIINLVLTPSITIIDQEIAMDIGFGLAFSGLVSVGICFIAHTYMPDEEVIHENHFQKSPLTYEQRLNIALKALVISMPLVIIFFYYQLSQILLTVAFVALLSLMLTSENAGKTSIFFVISNLLGGTVAFIAYLITSLAPSLFVYLLIMLLIVALFSIGIYTLPKKSPILVTGFTGFIVLMGTSMTYGDLDQKFFLRIWQLFLVVIYVVLMSNFIDNFKKTRV
ncbi:DUF2955 domain-containing protein [Vibrio mediterranei]|uniref:DUF2955 domain-containing protein n=1 Tax=Vibrio mediterranei TaxID=689 RepID=UPI0038CE452F